MSTVAGNRIMQAAMEYASIGWHILPLADRNKVPRIKAWQRAASIDEEQIMQWWTRWPNANVGVQLGRRSNLVDIEGDTKRAEKEIVELFGDAPICPTFIASRGKHRLFRWRSDLPGGACIHIGEIEVRTGNGDAGAQSVFPPSIHPSGKHYEWLQGLSPSELDPPLLTDAVLAKLWNFSGEDKILPEDNAARTAAHWEKILAGLPEGGRNEGMASLIGHLLRNATSLSDDTAIRVLYTLCQGINERHKPPLPEDELRRTFTGLLKREGNRRTAEDAADLLHHPPENQIKDKPVSEMRVVIVDTDPLTYELHAPQFVKANGECLVLTAEQMCSGNQIRIQALKQAKYPLVVSFAKMWGARQRDGGPSLYERLVFAAEERDAPSEEKRHVVVAERLRAKIAKPRLIEDGQDIDPRGRPCLLPSGDVLFLFTTIWEDLNFGADRVTRNELSAVLTRVRAGRKRIKKARWIVLSADCIRDLDELVAGAEE